MPRVAPRLSIVAPIRDNTLNIINNTNWELGEAKVCWIANAEVFGPTADPNFYQAYYKKLGIKRNMKVAAATLFYVMSLNNSCVHTFQSNLRFVKRTLQPVENGNLFVCRNGQCGFRYEIYDPFEDLNVLYDKMAVLHKRTLCHLNTTSLERYKSILPKHHYAVRQSAINIYSKIIAEGMNHEIDPSDTDRHVINFSNVILRNKQMMDLVGAKFNTERAQSILIDMARNLYERFAFKLVTEDPELVAEACILYYLNKCMGEAFMFNWTPLTRSIGTIHYSAERMVEVEKIAFDRAYEEALT